MRLIPVVDWSSMHDLWFLSCWKMSFGPRTRTEVEYLMELVSMDRTWFIINLKNFELNA